MKDVNGKLENWIMFPRSIRSDFIAGKMTRNEFTVLAYLRSGMNPYGVVTTSLENIVNDILPKTQKNYANQLLLSLKSKRYLYYHSRSGQRGSFDIYFGDFKHPNGFIQTLDRFFESKDRGSVADDTASKTEVRQTAPNQSQSFDSIKDEKEKLIARFSINQHRDSNNDTNTKNKNNTNSKEKRLFSYGMTPRTFEEQRGLEIAKELEEASPKFVITSIEHYGIDRIEDALNIYYEESETQEIENPGAYFNQILQRFDKS